MFSAVAIFKVRVACEIGRHLNLGLSEWWLASTEAELAKNDSELLPFARAAEISAEGNWMWAVARAVEADKKFKVYGYATFQKGDWLFEMHVGDKPVQPSFGTEIPHVYIYIPMSDIFSAVYVECKKLLCPPNTRRGA